MKTSEANYPPEQRRLLIDHLGRDIRAHADEAGVDVEAAFLDVAVRDLGYDIERGFRSDGSGDFGFDYLEVSEREAYVFQSKGVDAEALIEYAGENSMSPDKLSDLHRILTVLEDLESIPENANSILRKGLEELRVQLYRAGRAIEAEELDAQGPNSTSAPVYTIIIVFVAFAKRLSAQAIEEYDKLINKKKIILGNIRVDIRFQIKLLDDLIGERWRKENENWRDKGGKKREKVRLTVCEGQVLRPGQSYVFFTHAIDLVRAYEDFGYQIFEPNVRAEIHNSPVNKQIKGSVTSRKGRAEFRHLNNGITIIADSIQGVGPKDKLAAIDIIRPGIVNGLQTVKSLHDGYKELATPADQGDFEQNCSVLCRVHGRASVSDVNQLIKATNNQNAMRPRNLRSNDPEQLIYEQLFAELNWFYERKEGAWRAFKGSPRGWPKLGGRQAKDFRAGKTEKVVDNEELAQNWLSFIGYSKEAINERREIFSPERTDLYRLCFLLTPERHGYHYSYRLKDGAESSLKESPSAGALLLAQLSRELYEALVPGPKNARNEAIERLGIRQDLVKEELETKLINDDRYMTNRVMNGTKTLFGEFIGYIMIDVYGRRLNSVAIDIMNRGAFGELFNSHSIESAKKIVESNLFSRDQVLISVFELYKHCIYRLITDPAWKRQYDAANVKSRFLYEDKNRQRLIDELLLVDKLIERRGLGESWSDIFDEAGGVFKFFKTWLPVHI